MDLGLALLLGACSPSSDGETSAPRRDAIGEPVDGFPSWAERLVFEWTNRARSDPAADLASCAACAERGCYGPVAPLAWDHNLARAARFHSDNLSLAGCALQHDSTCSVLPDIDLLYTPGPCDGAPDCACVAGTLRCGSVATAWTTRISYFGSAPHAENMAAGLADPVSTFYLWLCEADADPTCGWRVSNGHRANILGDSGSIGVGRAVSSATFTQDFGYGGAPTGVVSGVHYPQTGATLAFRATWYSTAGPTTAMVNIDGACTAIALERGSTTNGTYLATVSGLGGACMRYYFQFTDGAGNHFYPTTGAFGINCTTDWSAARPGLCGACTADCTGRSCGSDGCGGSCGTCLDATMVCGAGGQCLCQGETTACGGRCVDLRSDGASCGECDRACAEGAACVSGECQGGEPADADADSDADADADADADRGDGGDDGCSCAAPGARAGAGPLLGLILGLAVVMGRTRRQA
jgi:hypothetical protein